MYSGDIKLTNGGETIVCSGDMVLTTDDSDYIILMLKTSEGSWKIHPNIGIGMEGFIGATNNAKTRNIIKNHVTRGLKDINIMATVLVLPSSQDSIVCNIEMYYHGATQIEFAFNLSSGSISHLGISESISDVKTNILQTTNNIYLRRAKA